MSSKGAGVSEMRRRWRKEGRKEGRGGSGGGAGPTNKNARFLSAAQTELECGGGKNGAGEGVDEMGWCARSDL